MFYVVTITNEKKISSANIHREIEPYQSRDVVRMKKKQKNPRKTAIRACRDQMVQQLVPDRRKILF